MIAYRHPTAQSILGDTWPVKAPSFSQKRSWAPSPTDDPRKASATVPRAG